MGDVARRIPLRGRMCINRRRAAVMTINPPITKWPSIDEIAQACKNLWPDNQFQHIQTVIKVLAEISNIRRSS